VEQQKSQVNYGFGGSIGTVYFARGAERSRRRGPGFPRAKGSSGPVDGC